MSLLPRPRIGVLARTNLARAGLTAILQMEYEIVHPEDDPEALALDIDEWPADLPIDRPSLALTDSPTLARALTNSDLPGWGCIRRDSDEETIRSALKLVLQGHTVCETEWLPVSAQPIAASSSDLSPREQAVLQLMAQGLANKEIAAKLGLSVHTVKFHVAALLEKLGAASRTEAVMDGIRMGLISL